MSDKKITKENRARKKKQVGVKIKKSGYIFINYTTALDWMDWSVRNATMPTDTGRRLITKYTDAIILSNANTSK